MSWTLNLTIDIRYWHRSYTVTAHYLVSWFLKKIMKMVATSSGGFRGYAGYAAAYPIDWTGCIFVSFNLCPIVCNWIFGLHASVISKPKHWTCLSDWGWHWPVIATMAMSEPWDSYLESSNADQPQPVCIPCSATGGGNVSGVYRRQSLQAPSRVWTLEATLACYSGTPKAALDAYTQAHTSIFIRGPKGGGTRRWRDRRSRARRGAAEARSAWTPRGPTMEVWASGGMKLHVFLWFYQRDTVVKCDASCKAVICL